MTSSAVIHPIVHHRNREGARRFRGDRTPPSLPGTALAKAFNVRYSTTVVCLLYGGDAHSVQLRDLANIAISKVFIAESSVMRKHQ